MQTLKPLFAVVLFVPAMAVASALDSQAFRAQTQPVNFVEIGMGHVSDDSARFGRYNGLHQKGFFGLLDLAWLQRADWDAANSDYLAIRVQDAGLDNRRLELRMGRQGQFGLQASYREQSARWGDGLQTIYRSDGDGKLSLPADWQPAASTAGLDQLLPTLHEFDLHQQRRQIAVGGHGHFAERWRFSSKVRQEDRDGQRTLAGLFGNTGGNPRAAFLPVPVDYRTRFIDLGVDYADRRRQFRFGYHASLFNNNQGSVRFDNPFAGVGGWAPGSGFPDGSGQLALAPDNQFHQLSAAGAFQFRPGLRGLAELAVGRMSQDETFLPLTANPILAESVVQGLPASSLDGQIDTTVINLRLSGRNTSQFQWNASYRFDDRDNRTERREFVYIGGDSQLQDVGETSSRRRYNPIYDYRNQRLRLDGSWRLPGQTRLSSAYQRVRIERSETARKRSDEDQIELRAQKPLGERVQASARVQWSDRRGSAYDGANGFLASHDPGYTDTLAGQWANLPALRQFHLADRRRHQAALSLQFVPIDALTLGLETAWMDDDYRRSEVGLSSSQIRSWSTHLSYTPSQRWSANAFFSREFIDSEQLGFSFRGGPNRLPDLANPERAWQVDHSDRADTAGLGLKREWLDGRLSLSGDYVHARARARLDVSTGTALDASPLPPIRNRLNSYMLRASYRINPALTLHGRLWRETFASSDWALDEVAVNQLANVILAGEQSPNYRVNVLSASLNYRF